MQNTWLSNTRTRTRTTAADFTLFLYAKALKEGDADEALRVLLLLETLLPRQRVEELLDFACEAGL